MKTKITIIALLFASCSDPKSRLTNSIKVDTVTTPKSEIISIDCNLPKIENEIVASDTLVDYKNYKGHLVKYYDLQKRLRKTLTANFYENNSNNFFSAVKIYDTSGHIIYENQSKRRNIWMCYTYKYDSDGHMISKEGFGSGDIGSRVTYIYRGDKLINTITDRQGKKAEINY